MNKKYFYISAILLLFSCNKKENTNTELNIDSIENSIETKENSTENEVKNNIAFDDSKTFEELYELPEYEKLQKDETFKKYIRIY